MRTVLAIALALTLSGCGNMSLFDLHWTFKKALVRMPDGTCREYEIEAWHDFENSDMIQIETKHEVICTHSVNVLLIKSK
ncbi:MAG: hypothetical protein IKL96_04415 [Kiritimatiellae bacterium]|nr:hypothetical protein [Kiritimatiellia bacterium]